MHLPDAVAGVEKVGFPGARSPATDVNRSGRAVRREDHGAPGGGTASERGIRVEFVVVPDAQAHHIDERIGAARRRGRHGASA
nr:hypothetical protein GCM10017611_44550 [Rhodococcus wratislaviensis]